MFIPRVIGLNISQESPGYYSLPRTDQRLTRAVSSPGNIVLYCIPLHCIALYCIALHCIALHCIALHCIVLHCIVLHCIVLYCIVLYCTVLLSVSPETIHFGLFGVLRVSVAQQRQYSPV